MKKPFVINTIIILLITACNHSEKNPAPNSPTPNYMPLSKGSYWLYEEYEIDNSGIEISSNQFDSTYVEGDTLINNVKYVVIKTKYSKSNEIVESFARDSSDYCITYNKENSFNILLPPISSELTYLYNTQFFNYEYKIKGRDSVISVPAGQFKTINFRGYKSTVPPFTGASGYLHNMYAENVGLVKQEYFYYINGARLGIKLVRYKIAQ